MTDYDAQPADPFPHAGRPRPVQSALAKTCAPEVPSPEECAAGLSAIAAARDILANAKQPTRRSA